MDPHSTVHRAPSAAWRAIEGQVAIISTDVNRIRLLNAVGSYIWERCDGWTVEAIVAAVCREFTVDPPMAARDVEVFVGELVQRGMMTTTPGGAE